MKVVKSLHSGVLHRNFEMEGKTFFSVGSLWGFSLSTGKPLLEKDLWPIILNALPEGEAFDTGLPKFRAEYLVAGSFLSTELVPGGTVRIECGNLSKTLAVFGDRYWNSTSFDGPEPIVEMPLTYKQAFGGADYAANLSGKGLDDVVHQGIKRRPLPNVEYHDALVTSKNDKPRPASLGNVDITWSPRSQLAGTYDDEYINRHMPGFPPDMDPNYFCCGASDQWFDDFPDGRESYRITNMNLDLPELTGQLPGINSRLFLELKTESQARFVELDSQLDTVWFLPNQDCGVLIHRGVYDLSVEPEADIASLLIAHESQGESPRDLAHYEEQLARRTDPEKGVIYSISTDAIIPQGVMCGFKQMMSEAGNNSDVALEQFETYTTGQIEKLETQLNDQLEASGGPLKEHGFDGVSTRDLQSRLAADDTEQGRNLQAIVDKIVPRDSANGNDIDLVNMDLSALTELDEYMKTIARDEEAQALEGLRERIEQLKSQPSTESLVEDLERALEERQRPPVLPRIRRDIEQSLDTIKAQIEEARQQLMIHQSIGVDASPIVEQLESLEETSDQMAASISSAEGGYRSGAHFAEESRSPHEGDEDRLASEFSSALDNKHEFKYLDLAFTALSGLKISGKAITESYFEYSDLGSAVLENVVFSDSVLAHTRLSEAVLTDCVFKDCNLGACDLSNARFERCEFDETIFSRSLFKGAVFIGCTFKNRMDGYLEADLKGASFVDCDMQSCLFSELDLSGCEFKGSNLDNSNLIKCTLVGSRFTASSLAGVNVVAAIASSTDFTESKLDNVRFVDSCDLTNSIFSNARGFLANFRDSQLTGADFSGSNFYQCDFSNATMTGADFSLSSIRNSMFDNTDLERARFHRSDAMEASFQKARLVAANFERANLYGANFYGVEVGGTDFRLANLKKTLFKDWRPGRG